MIRRLDRLAVGGAIATTVDLGLFCLLYFAADLPVLAADAIALAVAAAVSFWFHRSLTFRGDPHVHWLERPGRVVAVMAAAAAADLVIVVTGSFIWPDPGAGMILIKLAAIAVAALVRVSLYRRALFGIVRRAIDNRVQRPLPPGPVRLSVVIPAYAEADRIGATAQRLRESLAGLSGECELIVVDDGSPDDTAVQAERAGIDRVLRLPQNSGKGAAVRAGVLAASGRVVAFTDADLAYEPDHLLDLVAGVEEGWDVVVGSRRHTDTTTLVRAGRLRELGGRAVNALSQLVLLGQHRDTQCGLKAMRRDVGEMIFRRTRVDGFAFDIELFYLVERYGFTLREIPVRVANSERSTVKVVPATVRLIRDLFRIRSWAIHGAYDLTPTELAFMRSRPTESADPLRTHEETTHE